jgi:hypothetical protein
MTQATPARPSGAADPVQVIDGVPVDSLPYRTLSDVDEVLTKNVHTMVAAFFTQFYTGHAGGIIEGHTGEAYNRRGYWGRAIETPGDVEQLQMRFSPPTILHTPLGDGEFATFSVRLTPKAGPPETRTAVLWPIESKASAERIETVFGDRCVRQLGAIGLHVLPVGLWERHRASAIEPIPTPFSNRREKEARASGQPNLANCATNIAWNPDTVHHCHAVRGVTMTLKEPVASPAGRRRGADREDERCVRRFMSKAAPGSSASILAASLVGLSLQDPLIGINTEQAKDRWDKEQAHERAHIVTLAAAQETPIEEHELVAATNAAWGVTSIVEADGLLALLANAAFDGALPDRLVGPDGIGVLIAFAARLAMRPKRFGLSGGTRDDQAARQQVCASFETTNEPLNDPANPPHYYALDLMIQTAFKIALTQSTHLPSSGTKNDGMQHYDPETVLENHKQYWHRVGTRMLTTLNGLGSLPFYLPPNTYGTPDRMRDDMAWARERTKIEHGCQAEGGLGVAAGRSSNVSNSLASPSEKRYALYRVLADVQTWAHTGTVRGHAISTPNSESAGAKRDLYDCLNEQLTDDMFDYWRRRKAERMEDLCRSVAGDDEEDDELAESAMAAARAARDGVSAPPAGRLSNAQRRELFNEMLCNDAMVEGIDVIATALTRGTNVSLSQQIQYFMVGPHAAQLCVACDAPVHVLEGVMFNYSFNKCLLCQGARCLKCAEALAEKAKAKNAPLLGEGACKRCGQSPHLELQEHGPGAVLGRVLAQQLGRVPRPVPARKPAQ